MGGGDLEGAGGIIHASCFPKPNKSRRLHVFFRLPVVHTNS